MAELSEGRGEGLEYKREWRGTPCGQLANAFPPKGIWFIYEHSESALPNIQTPGHRLGAVRDPLLVSVRLARQGPPAD